MKPPKAKYLGDHAIEKMMVHYGCQTSFHVARMRILGEIVSLKTQVSPIDVIKSFWGDNFPSFDHEKEASEFFNNMLAHWNYMARRGDGAKIKLSKISRPKTWDHVIAALRQRAEEIREGFLAGFTTDLAIGSYPKALNSAIISLKTLADQFDLAAEQIEADRAVHDQLDFGGARRMISEGTTQVERLLDVLCTVARAIARAGDQQSGEERVH